MKKFLSLIVCVLLCFNRLSAITVLGVYNISEGDTIFSNTGKLDGGTFENIYENVNNIRDEKRAKSNIANKPLIIRDISRGANQELFLVALCEGEKYIIRANLAAKNGEITIPDKYLKFPKAYYLPYEKIIKDTIDKFTDKKRRIMSDPIILVNGADKSGCGIAIKEYEGTIYFQALVFETGFGCTDESGVIYFIAENGEKINCRNHSTFNCTGESVVYLSGFGANKKVRDFLQNNIITDIKISGRTDSYLVNIEKNDAIRLMLAANYFFDK